ncbi:MAG: histidine kinase dimerization/phospho-acceptor domain-containing protein, partial [Pelagibacteraceae bacterium]
MSNYFNKITATTLLLIFITLFSLTVYSLISSNEIVRDAELIQYLIIADLIYLLILMLYLAIFFINYIKYRKRSVIGLRLFNKFFLFFGLFSILPSGLILISSAIFFNIEVSTWLGPAFKSTVDNSYQLAKKYIDQTEQDLITDSKFIKNYVLAKKLIDRNILQRFDISTVYNLVNDETFIEHIEDQSEILLKEENLDIGLKKTDDEITIFFSNNQLFSKVNIMENNSLLLLKNIDLETLNYYQNIIKSYNAFNDINNNKENIQITFFTIYLVLSTSLIIIFIIIGTNFSFRLAKPIRDLNSSIIQLKKGTYIPTSLNIIENKDDIAQLTKSFVDMSETIINQKIDLEQTNKTINDQLGFIKNIIENSPYGIFVIKNKHLIYKNHSSDILKSDNKSSYSNFIEELSKNFDNPIDCFNSSYEFNININFKNKKSIFFVKSILVDQNSFFEQIIIFNDYTDIILMEKNDAIADLARKISHEIKNPLTPMLLSSEFIENQTQDSDIKNSILSIKRQIFLIQNLVNEFSSFARLPKANNVNLNFSDIINVYIDEYKRNYKNINFISKIDENIIINFDQSYIDIILNNLFKNSIEALNK